ncbi:MAG: hypothetical protein ABR529_06780 [Actinomycetota bacterium]
MPGSIELWQESGGRWRWAYRDGSLEIQSNHPYAMRAEALEAARTAYPDVDHAHARAREHPETSEPAGLGSFLLGIVALWRAYRNARRR